MTTPDYWKDRLNDTAQAAADKNIEAIEKRQKKIYRQLQRELDRETTALYERIQRDGEVTPLSLYKKQRLTNMRKQVKAALQKIGKEQIQVCKDGFSQAVVDGYHSTSGLFNISFDRINKDFVNQIVDSKWSGEQFSSRIWDNLSSLAMNVEKAVVNSVAAGRNKDDAVKDIMKATGQSFSNADRLVRTEVMHCINQAQASIYQQAGATKYEVLVGIDERTCPTCSAMDGAVFPFSQMREGVNAPVFHPRCRCTIIPVLKSIDILKKTEYSSNLPDELVAKSLGAKARAIPVTLPDGTVSHLVEGSRITDKTVIAGKGRDRQIDEIDGLLEEFGGSADEWQKIKGKGYVEISGESEHVELHWYEEPSIGKVKIKIKRQADGRWYLD